MSKIIVIAEVLQAVRPTDPITLRSTAQYQAELDLDDFSDDEIINKRALATALSSSTGTIIPVDMIPKGTSIPFFIDNSTYFGATPDFNVICKIVWVDPSTEIATGRKYQICDMPAIEMDSVGDGTGDFTGWDLYGHDDGTGKFNEDTFVTLKR